MRLRRICVAADNLRNAMKSRNQREMDFYSESLNDQLGEMRERCDQRMEELDASRAGFDVVRQLARREKMQWACSLLGDRVWTLKKTPSPPFVETDPLFRHVCALSKPDRYLQPVPRRLAQQYSEQALFDAALHFRQLNSQLNSNTERELSYNL